MMLNIDSEPMTTPITNPRRAKKLRSTSGASTRNSTISSRTNAIAARTNGPTTASGAAFACGRACRANTSDTINVASKTKPIQSVRRLCVPWARAVAAPAEARPAIAVSISGTSSQKIMRQPATCVSAPPSSGPMLKPSIRNPVQAPIAAALRSGVALASTAASVLGTANAAARPCKARPASNAASVPARR